MSELLLVRHSRPVIDPGVPVEDWRLGDEGRALCRPLAEVLRPYAPSEVFTSTDPKALETAEIVGRYLQVPVWPTAGLHEHRSPFLNEGLQEAIERFFSRPDERVLGDESANEALRRFSAAVEGVVTSKAGETVAIVAHGRVISLFVAAKTGGTALEIWRACGHPSVIVLSLPEYRLLDVVGQVSTPS